MNKVSIIIPVYNEINNLEKLLEKVKAVSFCNLEKEIILVDDCSTDGSRELIESFKDKYKVFFHEQNQGKSAALKNGINLATGCITVIQDADLEYNPEDYNGIIQLILDGKADVVYGSRFKKGKEQKSFKLVNYLGNKVLTLITNVLYFSNLTDMETCYKAFKTDIIKNIEIKSDRFNFEPEITAKILKGKNKILEIPISYYGRDFNEGKKITWKDGVLAAITLLKYRFVD